jgi:hypothetical protein
MKAYKIGKSYIRTTLLGAAIIAVVFSHFAVSQFNAFQSEKNSVVTEAINKQHVEIESEFEAQKPEIFTITEEAVPVSSNFAPEINRPTPKRVVIKQTEIRKKETHRESKAERLRRAERLLTGV